MPPTFVTLDFERAVCRGSSSRVSPPTFPCHFQTPVHPTPAAFPGWGSRPAESLTGRGAMDPLAVAQTLTLEGKWGDTGAVSGLG